MGNFSQAELDAYRKKINEFPNKVSTTILQPMWFDTLADVGCGLNPEMAVYTIQQGRHYLGVDSGVVQLPDGSRMDAVEVLNRKIYGQYGNNVANRYFQKIKANVASPNLRLPTADAAHVRLTLSCVNIKQWPAVLKNLLGCSTIVLIEYDWATLCSSHPCGNHIATYRTHKMDFLFNCQVNPRAGCELKRFVAWFSENVQPLKGASFPVFTGEETTDIDYLIAMAALDYTTAAANRMNNTAEQLRADLGTFQYLKERNVNVSFIPPTLHAAVITVR